MYYVVHQVANISHKIILAGSDLELLVRLDFRPTAYLVSHLGSAHMSVGPPPWNQILHKCVCAKLATNPYFFAVVKDIDGNLAR